MSQTVTPTFPVEPPKTLPRESDLVLSFLFSSTLLSTINLNKLLHLILSSLVHEKNRLFCRAMLYLHNPKTNTLQGMLGISREYAGDLHVVGAIDDNPLAGHWDLDEEAMESQRHAEFCKQVRSSRIDLDDGCRIVSQVVRERQLCRITHADCQECRDCGFVQRFGMTSFAAVPLTTRNRLVGIIIVDNPKSRRPIGDEEAQLLQLFANQAGMALENSQLYRNLEEAHTELRDARQRLIHGAHLAAIGEMAASLSHELKTPLVIIGGFAARLARMLEADTPQRHYLDTIISETQRLEHLLGDVLAFSRKPTICYNRFDLLEVVRESLDDFTDAFEERNITIDKHLTSDAVDVLGDHHQLKQVFINLLVNAQEAMRQGGVLKIEVFRSCGEKPEATVLLTDSGGGIPESLLPRIFTPFFTTKQHGTGLGLPIVSRIIQNHGGAISARNHADGAEFRIILPLADSQMVEV